MVQVFTGLCSETAYDCDGKYERYDPDDEVVGDDDAAADVAVVCR